MRGRGPPRIGALRDRAVHSLVQGQIRASSKGTINKKTPSLLISKENSEIPVISTMRSFKGNMALNSLKRGTALYFINQVHFLLETGQVVSHPLQAFAEFFRLAVGA